MAHDDDSPTETLIPISYQLTDKKMNTLHCVKSCMYFTNPIVVYGFGEYGEKIYREILKYNGGKKIYISDKNDSVIENYTNRVYLKDLRRLYDEEKVVIIITIQNKSIAMEVLHWLCRIGIAEENIWLYVGG